MSLCRHLILITTRVVSILCELAVQGSFVSMQAFNPNNYMSRQYLMHAGNSGVMCLLCGHLIPIINNKSRQYLMRAGNSGVMCLLCGHLILITIRVVSIKCILAIQRIICHMLAFNYMSRRILCIPAIQKGHLSHDGI